MPYIPDMTDELDEHWLSETDVEGTCMDVEGYAAWIVAKYSGLWFWAHETYWDPQMRKAAPIAESEIIEQAKEEAFLAWGL